MAGVERKILVVGGGYGGLAFLRELSRSSASRGCSVQLVDATPFHTIKTRFHERAVLMGREAGLRFGLGILTAASGARYVQDEILTVDYGARRLHGRSGDYPYDVLVLAPGGRTVYFGVPGAVEHTVSLQTYEAADRASRRVHALGIGGAATPPRSIVVTGAGVEGLEVAAMLRQLAPPEHLRITVVERGDRLMAQSQCGEHQRRYMQAYFARKQISVELGHTVRGVDAHGVQVEPGGRIEADLVYWCSGVRREEIGPPAGDEPFRVNRFLQHPEHAEVFAVGDFATVDSREPFANLGSAQRAVYQGKFVAGNVGRFLRGKPLRPARYRPIGELLGFGDTDGVGVIYGLPVQGPAAALAKKANELKYITELYGDVPRVSRRYLMGLLTVLLGGRR